MIKVILVFLAALFICYLVWRWYFLRNPARSIPLGNNVVSPADGYVLYFKHVNAGEVPIAVKRNVNVPLVELTEVEQMNKISGVLIGVWMTPFSVHRNRAPLDGTINLLHHRKADTNLSMTRPFIETRIKLRKFKDLDNHYYLKNERLTTGFATPYGTIYVMQIADKGTNRLVSWVDLDQPVTKGEQFGMIRFGSQCDIFIPSEFMLNQRVKVGDYVYAGETVLAELPARQ